VQDTASAQNPPAPPCDARYYSPWRVGSATSASMALTARLVSFRLSWWNNPRPGGSSTTIIGKSHACPSGHSVCHLLDCILRQRRAIKPPIRCRRAPAALTFRRRSRGSRKAARGRWKLVRAAPAESPQGQTPPGMQAAPEGSSKTIVDTAPAAQRCFKLCRAAAACRCGAEFKRGNVRPWPKLTTSENVRGEPQ